MKLTSKLSIEDTNRFIHWTEDNKLDMHDINLLDDFLGDLGFKLEPSWTSSQWIYDYGDEDEVDVWYGSESQKWAPEVIILMNIKFERSILRA